MGGKSRKSGQISQQLIQKLVKSNPNPEVRKRYESGKENNSKGLGIFGTPSTPERQS